MLHISVVQLECLETINLAPSVTMKKKTGCVRSPPFLRRISTHLTWTGVFASGTIHWRLCSIRSQGSSRRPRNKLLYSAECGIEHASSHEEQPPRDYLSKLTTLLTPNHPRNPESSGSTYPTLRQVQPEEEPHTEASNDKPSRFVTSQVNHSFTFSSPY